MSNDIRGVEIFATGTHNGDEYTVRDLDDIVEAYKSQDFRPAVKIGHVKDQPGAPAYGWVANLRRVGNKLVADFTDMHASVVKAIRDQMYDRVSSEVYFNLKRGEKVFRRALKAVALLGADVPAVADLVPLHKMEFDAREFAAERSYAQRFALPPVEHVPSVAEAAKERGDAGARVHDLVMEAMRDNPRWSYKDALEVVLRENPTLAKRYRGIAAVELQPLHKRVS